MKKQKSLVLLLIFAMALSLFPQSAFAAKKKVKLNKKTVTVNVRKTVKITSATKFIHVTPSYNKKKIKKSQIGKYIKKIKKSSYFQFKFKKGKVTEIHYCED